MEAAYGKWGYYLLSLLQFMYPFLGELLYLSDLCLFYYLNTLCSYNPLPHSLLSLGWIFYYAHPFPPPSPPPYASLFVLDLSLMSHSPKGFVCVGAGRECDDVSLSKTDYTSDPQRAGPLTTLS